MLLLPFHMSFPLPKALIHQLFQRPILGRFCGVGLDKVVRCGFQLLVKAEHVIGGDEIDDSRDAIDLIAEDVADMLLVC